jgi:hypothetical protein
MNVKVLLTWFGLCLVAAGVTIAGVRVLDKPLGLQQKIASLGR